MGGWQPLAHAKPKHSTLLWAKNVSKKLRRVKQRRDKTSYYLFQFIQGLVISIIPMLEGQPKLADGLHDSKTQKPWQVPAAVTVTKRCKCSAKKKIKNNSLLPYPILEMEQRAIHFHLCHIVFLCQSMNSFLLFQLCMTGISGIIYRSNSGIQPDQIDSFSSIHRNIYRNLFWQNNSRFCTVHISISKLSCMELQVELWATLQ